MKMIFRGRRREAYRHEHPITPGRCGSAIPGDPLVWQSATKAYGRIDEVRLSGNFHVQLNFEEAELRNWILVYVEERPEEALKLISEMQAAAIIALSSSFLDEGDEG